MNVPYYNELSVKYLFPKLKGEERLMKYLPDYGESVIPEKKIFLWNFEHSVSKWNISFNLPSEEETLNPWWSRSKRTDKSDWTSLYRNSKSNELSK